MEALRGRRRMERAGTTLNEASGRVRWHEKVHVTTQRPPKNLLSLGIRPYADLCS
jgi:hypothetical protein